MDHDDTHLSTTRPLLPEHHYSSLSVGSSRTLIDQSPTGTPQDAEAGFKLSYPPPRHGHARNVSGVSLADPGRRDDSMRWIDALDEGKDRWRIFWYRFRGRGRYVSWGHSWINIVFHSPLNLLLFLIPIAWAARFEKWDHMLVFILCFLSIVPLEYLFEFAGEQMAFYLGESLGDLLVITLNNAVEATLGLILLWKCDLKMLQSTVTGVVILHLLLIPGFAFLSGGARIWEQNLQPHATQLNHSLLSIGVIATLIPTAAFAALDQGTNKPSEDGLVSDHVRKHVLEMSRGIAIILLAIYVASRIYLHSPPEGGRHVRRSTLPEELRRHKSYLKKGTPEVNVWSCILLLAITIPLMAGTAEWLVESIGAVRKRGNVGEPWFGMILLPLVSFSADGFVCIIFFGNYLFRHWLGKPKPPVALAKARSIDLSIQFLLFWLPVLILLGWWTNRPIHMLFDYFEVAVLLSACFLVNYVTADSKTNWAEGFVLLCLYCIVATVAWWYPGQSAINSMLVCGSVLTGGSGKKH